MKELDNSERIRYSATIHSQLEERMRSHEPTPATRCRAVYAGSFDPLTNGHAWLIAQAARAFDLTVAVATNAAKRPMFTTEERVGIVRATVADLTNITVNILPPDEFLARFARSVDAQFLIRGIRNVADLEAERAMQEVNRQQFGIETLFFLGPSEVLNISSSFVRGFLGLQGWEEIVRTMVPAATLDALRQKVAP